MPTIALTRMPSASLPLCELSFLEREPIDVTRANAQHAAYRQALVDAGAQIVILPALDALPDAMFVEDTAIVLDELAIIAPMGAPSRQPETAAIADTLKAYRPVHALTPPATLDGGDVLHVGRTLYVGQTPRTNRAALDQLRVLLKPFGYDVMGVPVTKCLHFKSGCAAIGDRVLVNPDWVAPSVFAGHEIVTVDPTEPWGANVLAIGQTVLIPASAPRTRDRLRAALAGIDVVAVDVSELQKAEAGVTCMSILIAT